MKIDPTQPSAVPFRIDPASAASSRPRGAPEEPGEESPGVRDRIELSEGAREITSLDSAERRAKVRELREQIDAGTYRVDSDGVARRIIDQGDV